MDPKDTDKWNRPIGPDDRVCNVSGVRLTTPPPGRGEPSRFEFTKLDASSLAALAELRERFQQLGKQVEGIGPGRSTALAMTKLEESYMWMLRALADAQRKEPGI